MKKCWDSNPDNRPNVKLISAILDDEKNDPVDRINDEEFKEAERYLFKEYKEDDKLITHPQAIYTSRLLDPYTEGLAIDFTESNNEK
ncbi:unnamed protein product [Rhizophagus irregularis]|uniref:Serine-threonine/tyrosine-protein kinase catalytic domain-containing protein n=1 Tax=Rhizophagus irregularis TaxID=588596 RepID=A0A916E7H2_9GLOM|nr:unnamed protein product [Rhizophagus irregularis]CAB5366908.1 unnamed protein product [Rhizophagus irregularis]